jgi:FtsZ-binding cell division protein ZapB
MQAFNWAGVAIAIVSLITAWLSGRSARAAAKYSADSSTTNSRILAETEAYKRARAMDVETIERQGKEIDEIREQNRALRAKVRELIASNEKLLEENIDLRRRLTVLEHQIGENHGQ